MQVGMTKDQGFYNKPSAAVHPGALAAGTLPQHNTVLPSSSPHSRCGTGARQVVRVLAIQRAVTAGNRVRVPSAWGALCQQDGRAATRRKQFATGRTAESSPSLTPGM